MDWDRLSNAVVAAALALPACDGAPAPDKPSKPASKAAEPTAQTKPKPKPGPTPKADPNPNPEPKPDPTPKPKVAVEFTAADGGTVHADHYPLEHGEDRPVVLLFHQAGWNAGEYEPIAPRLQALGFHAVAPDQRSGGKRDGRSNRTVDARGKSTEYLEAYPDLEATLAWAKTQHAGPVVVWGSSYSAALVFKLASEHASDIAAVAAFSPGEYIGAKGTVAGWAEGVRAPIFVTSASGQEVQAAKAILAKSPSPNKEQHEPAQGKHGSSILREDKNAGGTAPVWTALEAFLTSLG
ncbi:MAG: alpha/beta fold hydrolase [Myxococcota bacterium]